MREGDGGWCHVVEVSDDRHGLVRSRFLIGLVLALLAGGPAALVGQAQDSTRWLSLPADSVGPFVADLLSRFAVVDRDTAELVDRAEGVVRLLRMGDGATFSVLTGDGGRVSELRLELRRSGRVEARVLGTGAAFATARTVVRTHWVAGLLPLEGRIHVAVETGPAGSGLRLRLVTAEAYPCAGYAIGADPHREGDTLTVRILGIDPPYGQCSAVVAPAGWQYPLELDAGRYTVVFRYDSKADRYTVEVGDPAPVMEAIENRFTTLAPPP